MKKHSVFFLALLGIATLPQQLFSESLPAGAGSHSIRAAVRSHTGGGGTGGTGGGGHGVAHPVVAARVVDIKADEAKAAVKTVEEARAEVKKNLSKVTYAPNGQTAVTAPSASAISIAGLSQDKVAKILENGKPIAIPTKEGGKLTAFMTSNPKGGKGSASFVAYVPSNNKSDATQATLATLVDGSSTNLAALRKQLQNTGSCTARLRGSNVAVYLTQVRLSARGSNRVALLANIKGGDVAKLLAGRKDDTYGSTEGKGHKTPADAFAAAAIAMSVMLIGLEIGGGM